MVPQQAQDLTVPPPRRHRPVRRLVVADRLRPLAARGLALDLLDFVVRRRRRGRALGDAGVGVRLRRVRRLQLRGPVVDVPVVLVEEEVVLVEELGGERLQVCRGEGGQQEVGLEGTSLAGLV